MFLSNSFFQTAPNFGFGSDILVVIMTRSTQRLDKKPFRLEDIPSLAGKNETGTVFLKRAFARLRPYLFWTGVVSLVINLLLLTGPLFMLQVYDRVLASGSVSTLMVIGGLVLILYVFYGLLDGMRTRILSRIGQGVDAELTEVTFRLSSRLPVKLGNRAAEMRPVQDLDTLRQFLSGPGPAAMFDLPWMPFYMGVVFLFHPLLGFVALGGACIITVLIVCNEFLSRRPEKEVTRLNGERLNRVHANQVNGEALQAMGMEEAMSERWQALHGLYLERLRATLDRSSFFNTTIKTIRFMMQSGILATGAWLAIQGEISAGVMIAASIMMSRALAPIEAAVTQWRSFIAARQAKGRLNIALSHLEKAKPDTRLALPKQSLRVDQVSCGPMGESKPFVTEVSFSLAAGDGLGIIGPSGSGKSTLARALVGAVPTLGGSIRLDGAEIDQWAANRRGEFIGYLPQDLQLFEGTVADNICRFRQDVSSESIINAAKMANLHDFIVRLPKGYDTFIGRAGLSLSGGQKQRIALARAIYGNPFLLVLDEPNSNLDAEGEVALTSAVETLREQGGIVVVIAHRPSALGNMNKVLCMRGGQALAFGPRDEVLKKVLMPVPARAGAQQ